MQSIRISEGDRTTVLVYPLYQSPSTPDTLRPLRERRSVLSSLSQVYQIPIVRDLVDEIPTLIKKGAKWISDALKPRVTYEPRESYVQITELNDEESKLTPLAPALRETTSTPVQRHEEAPHHYDLATQQIRDDEVHRQLEQMQRNLHDLRAHTATALEGLRQRQDVDRVVGQLQNNVLQTENIGMYVRMEQQNSLEYLSNVLSIAQQGRVPPQLHQQLQKILQPYRQNGQAVHFERYPVTVQQSTRQGQVYLKVHLTTTRPMQWTMYRIHMFPFPMGSEIHQLQLPFRYFLLHRHLWEYIPLDPEEALACQQGVCHPTQPRHQVRSGHCLIRLFLGQNYSAEECPSEINYRDNVLVSTVAGIAYSVMKPTMAYIHCLQDQYKKEIIKRILLNNWGWIETSPGCYLETPRRQTHPEPFNSSQSKLTYHNSERPRNTAQLAKLIEPTDRASAGIIIGTVTLGIALILAVVLAHMVYEHHQHAYAMRALAERVEHGDAAKTEEYQALEEKVRLATNLLSVHRQSTSEQRPPNPTPPHLEAEDDDNREDIPLRDVADILSRPYSYSP